MRLPNHNDIIVFRKVPNGSYATAGVVYQVERNERGRVHLQSMAPGGGRTSDSAAMYAKADWTNA